MKTDWDLIKEKIKNNVSDILKNGRPSFSDINGAIELFKKTLLYKSDIHELDGLPKVLVPALHEAYITNKGEIGSLRHIATSLDAYLKKLLVLAKNKPLRELNNVNLISLFKALHLNQELDSQAYGGYPQLEKENLDSFKGKDEYLEYLGYARVIRNEVHNSPNWNEIEVFTYLRNILVVYLYATVIYKTELQGLPRKEVIASKSVEKMDTGENKMLFDFISFGNTTTEIKTQAINAYILHFLTNNVGDTITSIIENTNRYFGNQLSSKFFERRVNALIQNGQIEYADTTKNNLRLTLNEKERISKITKDFTENKELFFLYFDEILVKYNIETYSESLIEQLKGFFEANFNIDVIEAYDKGIEIVEDENSIYSGLINYLKGITNDDTKTEALFRDLLELCHNSDFLVRISASKVFSRLTNPDQFQNYLRIQKRVVYLDTQIVLHALCLNYSKNIKYDNIFYRVTDELIDFVKQDDNIELKVSKRYLSEVVYQLKLALLLIPFEDFNQRNLSNNLFYLFYIYLKENELLEAKDEGFGNFLENWLLISEDDVYDSDFEQIAKSGLQNLLKDELDISVVQLPHYDIRESAVSVLEEVIKKKLLKPKSHYVMVNDALMVCHLSDKEFHDIEPFFLTWDKSFTDYRKLFKSKFSRLEPISWHLFNPSKFLNHMSLLDFKIDPKSITNEYMSIIDSLGIHEKTQTIYDNINKLLDLKDISKGQRRKYVQIAGDIFNDKEFSYDVNLPDDSIVENLSDSFSEIIERINHYYYNKDSNYSIHTYRKVMLVEESFVKIANVIAKEIKESMKSEKYSNKFLKEIDEVLKEYEDKKQGITMHKNDSGESM
jgi:hypothetical protein